MLDLKLSLLFPKYVLHWSDYVSRGFLAFLSFMHIGTAFRCILDVNFLSQKIFHIPCAKDASFHHIYAIYSLLNGLILMQSSVYLYVYPLTRLSIASMLLFLVMFAGERYIYKTTHFNGSSLFPIIVNCAVLVWITLYHYIWKPYRKPSDDLFDLEREVLFKYGLPVPKDKLVNKRN